MHYFRNSDVKTPETKQLPAGSFTPDNKTHSAHRVYVALRGRLVVWHRARVH